MYANKAITEAGDDAFGFYSDSGRLLCTSSSVQAWEAGYLAAARALPPDWPRERGLRAVYLEEKTKHVALCTMHGEDPTLEKHLGMLILRLALLLADSTGMPYELAEMKAQQLIVGGAGREAKRWWQFWR